MLKHMFFKCHFVRRRWAAVAVWLMGSWLASSFMKGSLGEIFYAGISRAQRSLVPLVVVIELISSIWKERNVMAYCGDRTQIPI